MPIDLKRNIYAADRLLDALNRRDSLRAEVESLMTNLEGDVT